MVSFSKRAPIPYESEVRRFVVGGLVFVLFLAGVSLTGLWATTGWAISSSLRRHVAETQAVGELVRRSELPVAKALSDPLVLDRLSQLRPLQAAIYDADGSLLSEAAFLPWSLVLPERLEGDAKPRGLSPVARLTSLQGLPAIAVTLAVPERQALVWIVFDGAGAATARRTVNILTTVVPAGAIVLIALVAPFLRRLLAPMEALAETALTASPLVSSGGTGTGEPQAAIEIFRRTVGELRLRTEELERLRRAEKERADALAVTSETLVRSHPGGLLVVDAAGVLTEANAPAREALDLDGTAVGRNAGEVLSDWAAIREALSRAEAGEPTLARELLQGDGTSAKCLAVTTVPVADSSGRALGTLVFIEDRSAETRLRAELSRKREMAALGEMSAGIAHEFRNATATILGWTRLAAVTDEPQARAGHLARIKEEADHVARVTGDFLLFARPGRLSLERTDLDSLVDGVVAEERLVASATEFRVDGALGEAVVDPGLLRRALVNLLRNAREAAGAAEAAGGGVVRISGERVSGRPGGPDDLVRIVVEDSGPGIPSEAAARLFVPFFSTKAEGTGLGLSLVARIAALHGGSVAVDRSRDLGGASFALTIPARSVE